MFKYMLYHNGYIVGGYKTEEECLSYIDRRIQEYIKLKPIKIYDRKVKAIHGETRIVVYQYYTEYREIFMIDSV